jgi:hypothetical protein
MLVGRGLAAAFGVRVYCPLDYYKLIVSLVDRQSRKTNMRDSPQCREVHK